MFAVEVFTGKVPFEDETQAISALWILRGVRPGLPEDGQAVGLTDEIWELLETCWQENPKKRPTMEEIVRRWEKFVEHNNDDNKFFPECVKITFGIRTSPPVPFSTSYNRPRELQPPVGPTPSTSQIWAETEVPQPPTMPGAARLRTGSDAVQPRTEAHQLKPISESRRPRTTPEAVQPRTQSPAPPPSESVFSEGCRSQVLITTVAEDLECKKGCGCIIM